MSNQELTYLHEMGIQAYQLSHPDRLQGYSPEGIRLPVECKLLLVSPQLPSGTTATLFENILKTINLTLEDTRHLSPELLSQLSAEDLEWAWFAGCDSQSGLSDKVLHSPSLAEIDGNQAEKRALWQQIQALK